MSNPPPSALHDPARLRALRLTGLLDSQSEEAFDRLTRLASRVLRVPIALVSLVDDQRQFFKSAVGLAEPWASRRETPLSHSFCQHVVGAGEALAVSDAREHPLLRDSLAVPELGVVAYAGVPLLTADAHALGALCVIERVPRAWTDDEVELLRELARSVMGEIELRRVAHEAAAAEGRYRELIAGLDAVVWEGDFATRRLTYVSPQCEAITGVPAARWLAAPDFGRGLIDPADRAAMARWFEAARGGAEAELEFRVQAEGAAPRWLRGRASATRDAAGAVRGARGVMFDVSARKSMEVDLAAQTAAVALLQAVAVAANEAASSELAIARCLSLVGGFMGWPLGHAYVARGRALAPSGLWHAPGAEAFAPFRELTARTPLEAGRGLPGRVLASGRAEWTADISGDPEFPRAEAARASGLRSGVACPVLAGDEVAAVLEFYTDATVVPDERTRALLSNVGTQLGRVIERERHAVAVEALSVTDELTGLHNRRGFLTLARQHLRAAERAKTAALLCFIDMDGLKPINDRLGHEVGDQAIADLAAVLRRTFRASDIVARFGGDEFVALAVMAPPESGSTLAERLRAQLDAHAASAGRPYTLGVSLGLTPYDPEHPESIEALLARADALMYEQKRARRGR